MFFVEIMQLLETIQVRDGQFQNIKYHNLRFNNSRKELFGIEENIKIQELIEMPSECSEGIFRCRIVYDKEIMGLTISPYIYKEIKKLKLVDIGDWEYSHKYSDRSFLTHLLHENKEFDEVIMVQHGFITDCTIANLVFWDGKHWVTSSTPLLKGTKRQQLLDSQRIIEREIRVDDLSKYKGVCLINAFRELREINLVKLV